MSVQKSALSVAAAKKIVQSVVPNMSDERHCKCARALENAIMTDADAIPPITRKKLDLLVGKYLK